MISWSIFLHFRHRGNYKAGYGGTPFDNHTHKTGNLLVICTHLHTQTHKAAHFYVGFSLGTSRYSLLVCFKLYPLKTSCPLLILRSSSTHFVIKRNYACLIVGKVTKIQEELVRFPEVTFRRQIFIAVFKCAHNLSLFFRSYLQLLAQA